MSNKVPVHDPQLLWQSQRREHSIMSIEEIRVRAEDAHSKVRRNIVIGFALGALVLVLSTIAIITIPIFWGRIFTVCLMALTVLVAYRTYARMWWSEASVDAGELGCVGFYREELLAQHRTLQMTWRFLAAVVVLAFLTRNALLDAIPANARFLVPGVFVVIMIERRWEALKIKRKLIALDAFANEKGEVS